MPSSSAARAHGLSVGPAVAGTGAVSARNCSTAATTAVASVSDPAAESSSIRGRGGLRAPFEDIGRSTLTCRP